MEQRREVGLRDLLLMLRRRILLLVLITVLAGLSCFLYARFLITPVYQAQALLIVNANDKSQTITYDDVSLSQKLVDTYAIVLKSRTLLDQAIADLGLNTTSQALAGNISVKAVGTTEVIDLIVRDTDPYTAAKIANEIIKLAPDEIIRTVKAGSVEIISPALADTQPVAPKTMTIAITGALAGLALSCVIVITVGILNDKVKTEEDVQACLGYTVIGIVPDIRRLDRKGVFQWLNR